jgi:hypothetical protein
VGEPARRLEWPALDDASTPSRVKAAPLTLRTFLLRKKAFGPLTRSYVKA